MLMIIVERSTKYVNDLSDARVGFLFSLSRNPYAVSRHLWSSAAQFFFFLPASQRS